MTAAHALILALLVVLNAALWFVAIAQGRLLMSDLREREREEKEARQLP